MSTVKFINADVRTALQNVRDDTNDPAFILFDENWLEVGRCYKFSLVGAALQFDRDQGYPRVYVVVDNPTTLRTDHEVTDSITDPIIVVPSSRGMYRGEPMTIDDTVYVNVFTVDEMIGHYDKARTDRPFWVEVQNFGGTVAGESVA